MLNVPSIIKRTLARQTFKYKGNEFGGWVIFNDKEEILEDVIVDTQISSGAHVTLSATSIMKQPPELRSKINGWFHCHPITGLSGLDESTKEQLTRLWGTCFTVVLQSDNNILIVKSILKNDKVEDVYKFEVPIGFKTYEEPSVFAGIFGKRAPIVVYEGELESKDETSSEENLYHADEPEVIHIDSKEPTVVIKKKGEEHLPEIYE